MIITEGELYIARNLHLSFEGSKKGGHFHKFLTTLFKNEAQFVEDQIDNNETLFTFFNVLVSQKKFPKIKSDLILLLERFFEEHEDKNGDKALKMILGMHF